LRPAKRAKETQEQQRNASSKEQEIRPWKVPRDWITHEEAVEKQSAESENETNPDWPVPFPFHADLAVPILKTHR